LKIIFAENLVEHDLDVAVGVEGRVNVNQIHAGVGQLGELFQIVAAINDAGVEEGGRFGGRFLCHAVSVRRKSGSVNPRLENTKPGIFQPRLYWILQPLNQAGSRFQSPMSSSFCLMELMNFAPPRRCVEKLRFASRRQKA